MSHTETPTSIAELSEQVRSVSGLAKGKKPMYLEEDQQRKEGKKLTEQELTDKITDIESHLDELSYDTALERRRLQYLRQRIRLKSQLTGQLSAGEKEKPDSLTGQKRADVEQLQEIDRRLTYHEYEEAAAHAILQTVDEYEQYRARFQLDRPVEEGGVPRDAALEGAVKEQLSQLRDLFQRLNTANSVLYLRSRLAQRPELQQKLTLLEAQLPPEASNIQAYINTLHEELRSILGRTTPDKQKQGLTTPLVMELQSKTLLAHFDSILERRKAVMGEISPSAALQLQRLLQEHRQLIEEQINFNNRSTGRLVDFVVLLSREEHIELPVDQPASTQAKPDPLDLKKTNIDESRQKKSQSLRDYIHHFRGQVLREEKGVRVPVINVKIPIDPSLIMEDLFTTYIVPYEAAGLDKVGTIVTSPHAITDYLAHKAGFNTNIQEWRKEAFMAPLYQKLGLPENYGSMTKEQRVSHLNNPVVQSKLRSLRTIIDQFKSNEGKALREVERDLDALDALRRIRSPQDLVLSGEPTVYTSMPDIAKWNANTPAEDVYGAYVFVLRQLHDVHLGAMQQAEQSFIQGVNASMDMHIEGAGATIALWKQIGKEVLLICGVPLVSYAIGKRGGFMHLGPVRLVASNFWLGLPLRTINGPFSAVERPFQAVRGAAKGVARGKSIPGKIAKGVQGGVGGFLKPSLTHSEAKVQRLEDKAYAADERATAAEERTAQANQEATNARREATKERGRANAAEQRATQEEAARRSAQQTAAAAEERAANAETLMQGAHNEMESMRGQMLDGLKGEARALGEQRAAIESIVNPAERAAARAKFIEQQAQPFMRRMNAFCEQVPGARAEVAKFVLGDVKDGEQFLQLLETAHTTTGTGAKLRILLGEDFKALDAAGKAARLERAEKVMRIGLAGEAPATSVDAIGRLRRLGLPASSERLLSMGEEALQMVERASVESGGNGAARACEYLVALPETAPAALRSPTFVARVAQGAEDPAAVAKCLSSATPRTATPLECTRALDEASHLSRGAKIGRAAGAAFGAVLDGAFVGYDIYSIFREREQVQKQVDAVQSALDQLVSQGFLTKKGEDSYEGQGVTISLKDVRSMNAAELEATYLRTGVDAAAGAANLTLAILPLIGGASVSTGGLALVGVVVVIAAHETINQVSSSIDQWRRREFLRQAPTWLIAAMGSQNLIAQNEYDVMRENIGVMRSDILPHSWTEAALSLNPVLPNYALNRNILRSLTQNPKQDEKLEAREKAMQAMGYQGLVRLNPDVLGEIPGRGDPRELFDPSGEFLREGGEYQTIVRRFVELQLHSHHVRKDRALAGFDVPAVTFDRAQQLDVTADKTRGRWWQYESTPLNTEEDVRDASRRGMLLYVQHRRELQYRKRVQQVLDTAGGDTELKEFLLQRLNDDVREHREHSFVLNMHPMELPPWDGKETYVQRMLREKYEQVSSAPQDRSAELAATGYKVGTESMDLDSFIHCVEPHATESQKRFLEAYAEEWKGELPISPEEMKSWGDDVGFRQKMAERIRPLQRIDAQLWRHFHSDADLRSFIEEHEAQFDFYLAFHKHNDFYRRFGLFRDMDIGVTTAGFPEYIRLLRQWKDAGYPPLVQEQDLDQARVFAAQRSQQDSPPFKLPSTGSLDRPLSLRSLTGVQMPGYSPREDQVLFTVDGFMSLARRMSTDETQQRQFPTFNRMAGDVFADGGPFALRLPQRRTFPGGKPGMAVDRNGMRSLIGQNLTDAVAVHVRDVPQLMQQLYGKRDSFDLLRREIVDRRVFVVADVPPGARLTEGH